MNWKEFKNEVDRQLDIMDYQDDIDIDYIDWSNGMEISRDDLHIAVDVDTKELRVF